MEKNRSFKKDKLSVKILDTRAIMGRMAAKDVAQKIQELLSEKDFVNMIFAAAPSQNEFLEGLVKAEGIDWQRVNAFHMDEYIGLSPEHPQRFGNFLKKKIFDKVKFHQIYFLNPDSQHPEADSEKYADLLRAFPPDIVCMGIGENTHVAFNDPYQADFKDTLLAKVVTLDEKSRMQQVHDGCFSTLAEVPARAVTLSVPALMAADYVYCIVPGIKKAEAVYHTLTSEIGEKYPSTSLRNHPHAVLYLDKESASKLNKEKEYAQL